MQIWRLTNRRHANTAFSGIGNRKVSSRWIPEGYLAVYASESISLAVLENLVHMEVKHFGERHVLFSATIPSNLEYEEVDTEGLPDDWSLLFDDPDLHAFGIDWLTRAETAVLKVPSAVVNQESNFILNPEHTNSKHIQISEPQPFVLDPRFSGKG